MKGFILLFMVTGFMANSFGQISPAIIGMFSKQELPYAAPEETYSDQYLEEGEETTIPYKELSSEQLAKISGEDECRCTAYAVDQIPLKAGKIGLVVYRINLVDVMPYEELTYHLYIVDAAGKAIDNTTLNSEFYTSTSVGSDEISIAETTNSYIAYGEYDDTKDRLFIEVNYEMTEALMADFGQTKTTIVNEYKEIVTTGKIVDVTVYMED